MEKDSFLMRDSINPDCVQELSKAIHKNSKSFSKKKFEEYIIPALPELGLMERVDQVTEALHLCLPAAFSEVIPILMASLPSELPNQTKEVDGHGGQRLYGLNGFIMVSLTNYVSRYGLDDFDLSMDAFYEMTKRFSAEGSIRHFIVKYPEATLQKLRDWTQDSNMHVRRLASECTRPKLPWCMQLPDFIKDPNPIFPVLERLKQDPELYVRRSVANNLNDISKDHPDKVTSLLKSWKADTSAEMKWLIRHALRTLEKKGNPHALSILGYSPDVDIEVSQFRLRNKEVVFGEALEMEAALESDSKSAVPIIVDFVVFHKKANGSLLPKVFKWSKTAVSQKAPITLQKKHPMKPISTRKYYPGQHKVQLQVNGKVLASEDFTLVM